MLVSLNTYQSNTKFYGRTPLQSPKEVISFDFKQYYAGKPVKSTSTQGGGGGNRYIEVTHNPNYKVVKGDSFEKIANKFGVERKTLVAYNNMDENATLHIGTILKIPDTIKAKNINSLNDIASCLGVSVGFIKNLKKLEDDKKLPEGKYHNDVYTDNAGVKTIGIGHRWKNGEPTHLEDKEVLTLCANDLLKARENLIAVLGKSNYDRMPQSIKEALLDMVFNKGTGIITGDKDLLSRLKKPNNGSYEAAINRFTNNRSVATGKEMSGLNKRRLYDISVAIKCYNGKVPDTNIKTAQRLYDDGIKLLKQECKEKNWNFKNQLVGYNKDVKSYLGNLIKYQEQ